MAKYTPMPHQADAVKAVTQAFKTMDRCHIVMACGTGKTLTALAITEKLAPKSVVVFVPSLALINQFMKEWLSKTRFCGLLTLAVCSDESVTKGVEPESLLLESVDFPVSNSNEDIKRFLNKKHDGLKLIFCTYQSAILLKGLKIEFGIFDEAHKTAGYDKASFSFTLEDINIKIKKRLFMTATPRRGIERKDKNGEKKILYSMDDITIYGPRVYTLGFRQAINLGLICDYKIIISVVDTGGHQHKFNKEYELQEKAIALQKAIKKTGATKIITFHSSISESIGFSHGYKALASKRIKALQISSRLSLEDRAQCMQTFKSSKSCVLSNSRCLTEGVDVPAIDMVAFLSPKSSKIDIVQAIGRALRCAPGKKVGYVFLPLLIDEKNIQEAEFSEYSHIWQVLMALMEQDSSLEDIVKDLSRKQGAPGARSIQDLESFVQIFAHNKALHDLINVKIIENVGDTWETRFGQLLAFNKKYGESTPVENQPGYEALHRWCLMQRRMKVLGMLSEYRFKTLESICFDWAPIESLWRQRFEELKEFKTINGHLDIARRGDKVQLYKWCEGQRRSYHLQRSAIPQARINLLLGIGFDFKKEYLSRTDRWDASFNKLKTFSNPNLKRDSKNAEERKLALWIEKQRADYKGGILDPLKQKKLKNIGLILDVYRDAWMSKYNLFVKEFKSGELSAESRGWYSRQLAQCGGLGAEREALISKFPKELIHNARTYPDSLSEAAKLTIKELINYKKKHGSYDVPYKYSVNIYNMITRWRLENRRGTIYPIVKAALDKIGFNWESGARYQFELWLKSFEEYKKYHNVFSLPRGLRVAVPAKVINFRASCRANKKNGKLDSKRISMLDSIGFNYD